ncbi:MAG: response regulator transcription factor [Niastella sp.]|nr:response regulator transcription factor [Niastella sp.]
MSIKIAIVDDKFVNRNIIKNKLLAYGHFEIVLMAENGSDFLQKMKTLNPKERPDVALIDLEMPELDGVDTIAAATTLYPNIKYVVLTIFDDEDKIFKAIKAGAFGYLLKDENAENIGDMLWQMHESGAGPISPGIAHKILQLIQNNKLTILKKDTVTEKILFELTDRETEILKLLVKGLAYKEIGQELGISPNTAKKHVINVYQKLHVNSRVQALHLAQEKGLL